MTSRYPLVLNGTTIQELQTGDTLTGFASSGVNSDITSLSGLTTPLSPSQGGTGLSSLAANVATFLATPSSANLAAALTDETGTGANVFATNPTFPAQINLTANSGYNIYASGTANNYLAGSTQFNSRISVGASSFTDTGVRLGGTIGTAATLNGIYQDITFPATTTASAFGYTTVLATAAAYTLPSLTHIRVYQGTFSGNVTTQYGFECSSTLTGATNNYGFYGGIASGTNRYNLYMAGTADNYLGGSLGIGTTANASAILDAQSTTKGVRFPNMTTTQKNAVATPAAGLVVFDTTLSKLCVYTGAAWQTITSV